MKYYTKLILVIMAAIFSAIIVQTERSQSARNYTYDYNSKVVKNEKSIDAIKTSNIIEDKQEIVIIYDSKNKFLVNANNKLINNLSYVKADYTSIDINGLETKDYWNASIIVLLVDDLENKMGDKVYDMMDFVKQGGSLLFGVVPKELGPIFNGIYRNLGITEKSGYVEVDGIYISDEIAPGMNQRTFVDENTFSDYSINLRLDESCKVYIKSRGKTEGTPIFWTRAFGEGKIGVYNGGGLGGDHYGGIFIGMISTLFDNYLYPIINAKTVFLDDFPSPQYNSSSDIIYYAYNRTVKEFYRDIWWPDMQKAAKQFNIIYTGLFVSTYNDNVKPEEFYFNEDPMMKYYGNSLLKNQYELGLHGYNHQPLVLEGDIPKEMNYTPWENQDDMEASIRELLKISRSLFPGSKFYSYVPPSNYLSEEGREALAKILPDLKIISGIYSKTEEEGNPYVQKFEIAKDGIVEFPRISSGMFNNDTTAFEYLNGLALHGVFSHFIHPDDILDPVRGKGASWENLFEEYCKTFKEVNDRFLMIRSLTAAQAADAVKVYDKLEIGLEYSDNRIEGALDNFYGEAYFYLRTAKAPIAANDSCEIKIVDEKNGLYYYLVKITEPKFVIKLKG